MLSTQAWRSRLPRIEMTGSAGMEMSPSVLHGLKCRACGNFGYACTLQAGLREVGGPSGHR
jgi:hypothetical protein